VEVSVHGAGDCAHYSIQSIGRVTQEGALLSSCLNCSETPIPMVIGVRRRGRPRTFVVIGPTAAGFVVKGEVFAFVNLRTLFFVRRWLRLTTGE
jgi:hypothetical protein